MSKINIAPALELALAPEPADSPNLAGSGDRFWPRAHRSLDGSLRIWALQNN